MEAAVERLKTIKAANEVTGSLSNTSKMPEESMNLSAEQCNVGRRLQGIRGSAGNKYYALTNRYRHPKAKDAMERRRIGLFHEDWVPAMVPLIRNREIKHFRWHDRGDVQSV